MALLRGMLICEDAELRLRLENMVSDAGNIAVNKALDHYPEAMEASRLIRVSRPEVVFLVVDSMAKAIDFVTEVEANASGTPVIAISRLRDPRALAELMRFGVREFLATPLNKGKFEDTVRRVVSTITDRSQEPGSQKMYSFLPSRGGVGASTLACNVSHVLSQTPGLRVLLADFDLCAGLARYLLKLNTACSLRDLAEHGDFFNQTTWEKCIAHFDDLDILHGGKLNPRKPLTVFQVRQMISFALERYAVVCADISGNMEAYSLELLRKSKRVFLVTTAEFPSVELAKEKLEFLRNLELADRVSTIVTLPPDAPPPAIAAIEQTLGVPVAAVLDYTEKKVRECLVDGNLVHPKTKLAQQIRDLARRMSEEVRAA